VWDRSSTGAFGGCPAELGHLSRDDGCRAEELRTIRLPSWPLAALQTKKKKKKKKK
jgi:hypothetical protein